MASPRCCSKEPDLFQHWVLIGLLCDSVHWHFYKHEKIEEPWLLIIQLGQYDFRGSLVALIQTTIAFYSQASKIYLIFIVKLLKFTWFLFIVTTQITKESKCRKKITGNYLVEDFLQVFQFKITLCRYILPPPVWCVYHLRSLKLGLWFWIWIIYRITITI